MKILILIFFFEVKESKITRGDNYTLVKKRSRLDVRKYSFSQMTINLWNTLSTDCAPRNHFIVYTQAGDLASPRFPTYMSTVPHPEGQSRIFIRCPAVPRNQQMSRIFRKWYYYFFRCRLFYMFASQRNKVTNFE